MADMPVCFSLFFFYFLSDNQIFVLAMSSSSQQLGKYLSIFCFLYHLWLWGIFPLFSIIYGNLQYYVNRKPYLNLRKRNLLNLFLLYLHRYPQNVH